MTQEFSFKTLLICLVQVGSVFFGLTATAQKQSTSEIGLGLGAISYKGEISPEYRFANNRPAITFFYRKDLSVPITFRAGLLAGLLRADDTQTTGLDGKPVPLNQYRRANLKGSLYEASGVLEYNFFDYYGAKVKTRFSPYAFVGLAGFVAPVTTEFTGSFNSPDVSNTLIGLAVPAGVGFKVGLSRHWNMGLEVGARKAFTDMLDNISTQNATVANSHDQDWYYFGGVTISYTFYKIKCPDAYKDSPKLLQ